MAFLSDILPTALTGFIESSATAIAATDTILEAFQKVQKYLTVFLTNFNGVDQLLKLDGSGFIPKLQGKQITTYVYIPINIVTVADGTFILYTHPTGETETMQVDIFEDLKTSLGTCTVEIQCNGVGSTGISGLSVTSTGQNSTATANHTLNAGEALTLVISANSSATNLTGTLRLIRNP